jgi:hypothetical protein
MKDLGHATQLFLLSLVALIGYCALAAAGVDNPGLYDLLKEVIIATLLGGGVAVPPRSSADVTVQGSVNVDATQDASPLAPNTVTTEAVL